MKLNQIILSKGVYNLVKDHLKKNNKLSENNKKQLEAELGSARIIPGKDFPGHVVAVNTNVRVLDLETGQEFTFGLVGPSDAKIKNNKLSVLSPIGLALVGYGAGEEIQWEMADGIKRYRIEEVSSIG